MSLPLILGALPGGKYAVYIWPAYGVTVLGFAWMTADTLVRAWRWRRKAQAQEAMRQTSPQS